MAGGHIYDAYVNDNALLSVRRPSGTGGYNGYLNANGRIKVVKWGVNYLYANDTSMVAISDGSVSNVWTHNASFTRNSHGRDARVTNGRYAHATPSYTFLAACFHHFGLAGSS